MSMCGKCVDCEAYEMVCREANDLAQDNLKWKEEHCATVNALVKALDINPVGPRPTKIEMIGMLADQLQELKDICKKIVNAQEPYEGSFLSDELHSIMIKHE